MRNKFIVSNKTRIIFFYLSLIVFFTGLKFQDSGLSGWNVIYTPTDGRTFKDFQFLDSLNGFAITSKGEPNNTSFILKTTNSGYNWVIKDTLPALLNEICFVNYNTGYIGGAVNYGFGKVYKTTNGGDNWQAISFGDNGDYEHIRFINPDTGWVSCSKLIGLGGIWRTTNGGISWQKQFTEVSQISFVNSHTGWAINYDKIYKTTNSGENWNLLVTLNGQIDDIFFISSDTGWLTGGSLGTGTAISTNGGLNWIPQQNPDIIAGMKLFFLNNKRGWLGNYYYKIKVYIDSIWGSQYVPSMYDNYRVKFIDTIKGWAGRNQLLHTNDGGGPVTHITNNKEEIVINYILEQNYPNPFNQSSIINVKCSIGGDVKLKVYDINGKAVKILINGYKPAGTYSIRFDSGDLPSGIYFYSLIVDGLVMDTKKAILMK